MVSYDVVVLTDRRYLEDSVEPYKHNVFYEDALVCNALEQEGLKVVRKAWDDSHMDWGRARFLLFRTTWDYFDRFSEFSNWIRTVSNQTQLINSERLFWWNIDKHYLKDLKDKGINIPESYFIDKGYSGSLKELHETLDWEDTVLKPCISGAGRHTYRLHATNLERYEILFRDLIVAESFMLQRFQNRVVSDGEISLMLFNGQFTHAVLKKAKAGDFRVQDDFGGTVHMYVANAHEIAFAKKALEACPEVPTYARVDIIKDNEGQLAVSELELIEPELWFRECPSAATVLAKAVKERIEN